MAQSQTNLYNMALSAVGSRAKISLPTENSRAAEECQIWYDSARQTVLRAAHWQAAKKYFRLSLLNTRSDSAAWLATDPEPGWIYQYSAPSDMLAARNLSGFERFTVGTDFTTNVRSIECDIEDALLHYTFDQTDLSLWDASLYQAIAFALASFIAEPLTGKRSRVRDVTDKANAIIREARAQTLNEMSGRIEYLAEWHEARGFSGGVSSARYIYPFGNLISGTGAAVV